MLIPLIAIAIVFYALISMYLSFKKISKAYDEVLKKNASKVQVKDYESPIFVGGNTTINFQGKTIFQAKDGKIVYQDDNIRVETKDNTYNVYLDSFVNSSCFNSFPFTFPSFKSFSSPYGYTEIKASGKDVTIDLSQSGINITSN